MSIANCQGLIRRTAHNLTKQASAAISGGNVRPQHAMAYAEPVAELYRREQEAKAAPQSVRVARLNRDHVETVLDLFLGPYLDLAPLNRALGLTAAEARPFYRERLENAADAAISFVALDDDSKKTVGAIVNETMMRGRHQYTNRVGERLTKINELLRHVEGDAFAQLPHSNTIFKIHDAIVKQGYQNHGIGRTLLRLAVEEAQDKNCDYIVGTATSPLVQNILHDKLMFGTIYTCDLASYTEEETQEKPFQNIAHSTPSVVFMARNIVPQPDLY